MDYEKKYKEALTYVKDLIEHNVISKENAGKYFPELKESEDELTWLKKYIEEEAYSLSIDIRDNEDSIKLKNLRKALAWLEKQGEQKETPCDKCKKAQPSHSCQDITALGRCYLEHEQKPADKVEPKFKKGDWITNGEYTWYVEGSHSGFYDIVSSEGCKTDDTISHVDEHFRLWTIQDAKEGDVLVLETDEVEWVLIYKEIVTSSSEVSHDLLLYQFLLVGNYCNLKGVHAMVTDDYEEYLKPATKEQRDLLFQKMKEKGYEWKS